MTKKYKARKPEETISLIRNILLDCNIFLREQSFINDGMNSCRLNIISEDIGMLDIGTNGKGMSYLYALASGYAEFMERLENSMLLNHNIIRLLLEMKNSMNHRINKENSLLKKLETEHLCPQFLYSPDEKEVDILSVIEMYRADLCKMFTLPRDVDICEFLIDIFQNNPTRVVPFYSVIEQKVVYFPIDIALMSDGSNGMCAGNTPEEALLQGVCEIFERYSISNIFLKRLTPPTISEDLFAGSAVLRKMNALRNQRGYEFIIKDCSLGIGLPVIGLLTIDRKNNSYNFKLGADFVPHVALERCVTELYQSKAGSIMLPLLRAKEPILDDAESLLEKEYLKIIRNGTGHWPIELWGGEPSYSFNGFSKNQGLDDKSDLRHGIDLITNVLKTNLYIRDNSFLGFPAYNIVAPGVSTLQITLRKQKEREVEMPRIYSKILSKHYTLNEFIRDIEPWLRKGNWDNFKSFNELFPYYFSKELEDLDPHLLLCMISLRTKNYSSAYQAISYFLREKDISYVYYFACRDYIKLALIDEKNRDTVRVSLETIYGLDITRQVFDDLSELENIFKYYNFPSHLSLEKQLDTNESHLKAILRIRRRLEEKMLANLPLQDKLKEILS